MMPWMPDELLDLIIERILAEILAQKPKRMIPEIIWRLLFRADG